jgi:excisionase family DNA binding protein
LNIVGKDILSEKSGSVPMLFPYEPGEFWAQIRTIIKEELSGQQSKNLQEVIHETPGLTYKPLYKIAEVCSIFDVSKPTIYDWIKHGKLKPFKVRSRVYFLWNDIQEMMKGE